MQPSQTLAPLLLQHLTFQFQKEIQVQQDRQALKELLDQLDLLDKAHLVVMVLRDLLDQLDLRVQQDLLGLLVLGQQVRQGQQDLLVQQLLLPFTVQSQDLLEQMLQYRI